MIAAAYEKYAVKEAAMGITEPEAPASVERRNGVAELQRILRELVSHPNTPSDR